MVCVLFIESFQVILKQGVVFFIEMLVTFVQNAILIVEIRPFGVEVFPETLKKEVKVRIGKGG